MRERWLRVGVLALALFATNVTGRLIVKFGGISEDAHQIRVGLVALGAMAVITVVVAYLWARRRPMPRVMADLGVAVVVSCALAVLLGPLAVGERPFQEGFGLVFGAVWRYLGIAAAAATFGLLVIMAVGQDWKSQAWKRYADTVHSKPRRVVRR